MASGFLLERQMRLSEFKARLKKNPEDPAIQEYLKMLAELAREAEPIAEEIERLEAGEARFPGLYKLYAMNKINQMAVSELPSGKPGPKLYSPEEPSPRTREDKIAAWKMWQIINAHGEITFEQWSDVKWGRYSDGSLIVPKATFYKWPRS